MTANHPYVAKILQSAGLLDAAQVPEAMARAQELDVDLLEVLAKDGHNKSDLLAALAHHSGMETVILSSGHLSSALAEYVPADVATRYRVVPVQMINGTLVVAIGDPLDLETLDTLRYVLKHSIELVVALPEEIDAALAELYPHDDQGMQSILMDTDEEEAAPAETIDDAAESDEPIIRLVNLLILEGYRSRASDIHLEPLNEQFRVRYRIDGVLREVEGPPRRLHPSVISRIKIMAQMKISEKRLPQDGRIEIRVMGKDLDLRVSTIPTNHGESIVMRILDKESLQLGLQNLGFYADDEQTFDRIIRNPDGIMLITGPTGSGKTTTLYACLNHLNKPDRKIITVEDPVEYQLSGINQVRVRHDIGLTFSTALRSILRQAPNTIMIGEIRDRETAEIAVNAALTGHLVLSTLHTNDAPSAITRLSDIGLKPFLIASSVRGIMAQRLVRCICEQCKTPYSPDATERQLLGSMAPDQLHHGEGCPACRQTGYLTRKGIFELLTINDELRHMIHSGGPTAELRAKARELGMRTLREDGLRKAADGMTTLSEVLRVTMRDEN